MATLRLVPAFGAPIDVTQLTAVVGREPGCDVLVNDGSISRRHARIERRGAAWFVVDQGSANGTYLDSQRVADALLRPGQELRFGAVSFRVEIVGDVPAADGTVFTPSGAPHPPMPPPGPSRMAGAAPSSIPPPPPVRPGAPPPPPPYAAPGSPAPPPTTPRPARLAPPTPSAVEAAPPRAGRGPFFWVAMGCGGCLLAIVAAVAIFVGGPLGFLYYSTKGSADAAKAQIAEIRAGRLDDAYNRLSDEYRGEVSREAFGAFVERHPGLKQNADTTFNNRSFNNDRAELRGSLSAASGESETVVYRLQKAAGDWRITGIEVAGDRPEAGATDAPGAAGSPAAHARLQIETIDVGKQRQGSVVRVTIRVNVSGFRVRPDGDRFALDLAEDVQTLDPDGFPIAGLSKTDVQRLQRTTSMEFGAVVPVTTTLTLAAKSDAGRYAVRLTFRDLVGDQLASHEVAFELP